MKINKYAIKSIALFGLAIGVNLTTSYILKNREEDRPRAILRYRQTIEGSKTNIQYQIEHFCPEHLVPGYIPPTKDPNIINPQTRTNNTSTLEKIDFSEEETEKIA